MYTPIEGTFGLLDSLIVALISILIVFAVLTIALGILYVV